MNKEQVPYAEIFYGALCSAITAGLRSGLARKLVICFAGISGITGAQSTTQSIQGLVTDPSGLAIAGAVVTLTNVDTGVSRTVVTSATGNYSFPLVPVGSYRLRVELQGFKTETVTGLRLETGQQLRSNVSMVVSSVTETVEVVANAVALDTENATVGTVIENKRIVELPLNGRNVQNLAVLVPGVQFGSRTGLGDGSGGFTGRQISGFSGLAQAGMTTSTTSTPSRFSI